MEITREEFKEIVREVVREELAPLLQQNSSQPIDINMLPASKAFSILGLADARSLRELIHNGDFRLNKEYIDIRKEGAGKANYRFNIRACKKRLNELSIQRAFRYNY
ncbi:MAG: hypothetical protein AAGE96_17200 [Cyanobacteria bacterium P01_G01_bin.19]